jgi:hypothetical protein
MYECIMGMKKMEGTGCILADEMGLGKTLQTISLIYTLLREQYYHSLSQMAARADQGSGAGESQNKTLMADHRLVECELPLAFSGRLRRGAHRITLDQHWKGTRR